MVVSKIFKNKVIQYVLSRYFTYFIQFINSLFIAVYLGPFYLGIWGFINLVLQYFTQINFGIPYSVNVIVSTKKDDKAYVEQVFQNSIFLTSVLSFLALACLFFLNYFDLNLGAKYNFNEYLPLVALIIIGNYFIPLLSNVLRIYGKIGEIAFAQSILPLSMLAVSFFFKGPQLVYALIYAQIFSIVATLALFIYKLDLKFRLTFNWKVSKYIQRRGLLLFIYNSSFYLIIISTRSIISYFYNVSEFGMFTFAFTLGNTVNLLLSSLSFLIFPKVLYKLSKTTNEEGISFLNKIRHSYIYTSHFFIYILIFVFPVFLYFFPKYNEALDAFRLIGLTIVLYSNTFGYQGLLLAKEKDKLIATISASMLVLNVVLGFVFAKYFALDYSLIILATTVTYFTYIFLLGYFGRKLLEQPVNFYSLLNDVFPIKLLAPFLLVTSMVILKTPSLMYIFPVILFVAINYKSIAEIKKTIRQIIDNPKIINI